MCSNEEGSFSYTEYRNNTILSREITNKKYLILSLAKVDHAICGLGWRLAEMLGGIRAAVENGYIPVIDWQSYPIPTYDVNMVGKKNIWEYFFQQPGGCSLEAAYASHNYYLVDSITTLKNYKTPLYRDLEKLENKEGNVWRYYYRKYIRLKPEISSLFDKNSKEIFEGKKVLGILCRGTDYVSLKPNGHGIIPAPTEVLEKAERAIKDYGAEVIFLATEDKDILSIYRKALGNKLKYLDMERYNSEKNLLISNAKNISVGYERDLKYLMSLYFIAQADDRIYTACSGGIISSLINCKAEYYDFIFTGNYSPKGILIGSKLEQKRHEVLQIYDKPLIYYTINNMILLGIRDVTIIASSEMKMAYEQILGNGESIGLRFTYIVENDEKDIIEILKEHEKNLRNNRIALFYEDNFFFGGNLIREMGKAKQAFDGAYGFYCRNSLGSGNEQIRLNKITGIPDEAGLPCNKEKSNIIFVGVYFFDLDIFDNINKVYDAKKEVTLLSLLTEYIRNKKLLIKELERGAIWIKVDSDEKCEDISQLVRIIQQQRGQYIGCVEETALQKHYVNKDSLRLLNDTKVSSEYRNHVMSI